jgi:hypothetical protein
MPFYLASLISWNIRLRILFWKMANTLIKFGYIQTQYQLQTLPIFKRYECSNPTIYTRISGSLYYIEKLLYVYSKVTYFLNFIIFWLPEQIVSRKYVRLQIVRLVNCPLGNISHFVHIKNWPFIRQTTLPPLFPFMSLSDKTKIS